MFHELGPDVKPVQKADASDSVDGQHVTIVIHSQCAATTMV